MPDLSPAAWLVCAAAVLAGTMLQRLAGQGFGMVAAPFVALVAPAMVPATLLLIGAVVGFSSASIDRSAIARHELAPGFAGRALGAGIAAWLALRLSDSGGIAVTVALLVYLGIALSLVGIRVAIRPPALFAAGVVAGIMGTLTSVGAPPMALLYQHEPQRRSAVMQNVFFAWGMFVSIAALMVAGLVTAAHLIAAALLAPVALIGLRAAQPLTAQVARTQIRPYALGLAGSAATVLLARELVT